MAAKTLDPSLRLQIKKSINPNRPVVEEIDGLIKVFRDGHVERSQIVPYVPSLLAPDSGVIATDVIIDKFTKVWARVYVPKFQGKLVPFIAYFHGGGFCVGSADWSCYHEFLAKLAAELGCVIMSVNYRLSPENRLPAAYDDGFKALLWVKQQVISGATASCGWWLNQCDFTKVFLAGDSAGANIAHNVATRLGSCQATLFKPFTFKGAILIQPFFGGETRTHSEKHAVQPPRSALNLAASDTYWRLSLPIGSSRDHPWCNPLAEGSTKFEDLRVLPTMVCVSEMDILKDRNLAFFDALARAGKEVDHVVFNGVGHAFQILDKSKISQTRTHELMSHIKAFISK